MALSQGISPQQGELGGLNYSEGQNIPGPREEKNKQKKQKNTTNCFQPPVAFRILFWDFYLPKKEMSLSKFVLQLVFSMWMFSWKAEVVLQQFDELLFSLEKK